MKIRRNDTVLVIAGKDKGKRGRVRRVLPEEGRILVDGVNMIKRHARARAQARQAGIIEREASISISNTMLVCNKCNQSTRVGFIFLDDGKKIRTCRQCGEVID